MKREKKGKPVRGSSSRVVENGPKWCHKRVVKKPGWCYIGPLR